ncbi:MAG: alpha/beta fold hydrolase [Alphaproteobacteria bacterium]|nr:MAG: alpha/beta fold hydrolase [Alphaproteobacteria bacterium]
MPEVILNGSEGRLEGRYHHNDNPTAPVAIVLHPHPLYGGTMNNKVVYRIFQAFMNNGFSVLRFNFRGVGKSMGTYDEGVGELSDAATALDWIQAQNPEACTCWVSGFSFGAWIALQLLMRRPEIEGFVTASPPVNKYDFSFISPCPAAGLILQGDKDDIVQEKDVSRLVTKLHQQNFTNIDYQMFTGADHYFRNQLDQFEQTISDYLNNQMLEFITKRQPIVGKKRR